MDLSDFNYILIEEKGTEQELADGCLSGNGICKFSDILSKCNSKIEFCNFSMYKHQQRALEALLNGKDVVLKAQTGSGKTEVWVAYALEKDAYSLVIYPTKALTNDQLQRIYRYYIQANYNVGINTHKNGLYVVYGDVVRYDGDTSKEVKSSVKTARVVLTNPDMVLNGLKGKNALSSFFPMTELIVIDELDFYGSYKATILLYLIKEVLKRSNRNVRIIIMSATLSNVKNIIDFFPDRNFEIIEGKAYKPKNKYYIILGKKEIKLPNISELIGNTKISQQILRINKDYTDTILNLSKKSSENSNTTTIVFTPNISFAENLSRKTNVAVHHSRVSKGVRSKIETELREGKISHVITVKTLLQGIDIGNVTRIIHFGLPNKVAEFIQREGRKGRRKEIKETESIIVPLSIEDLVISKDLIEWKKLGSESMIIHSDNDSLKDYEQCIENLKDCRFYEVENRNMHVYVYDGTNFDELDDKISWRDYVENRIKGTIDNQNVSIVIYSGKVNDLNVIIETQTSFENATFLNKQNINFPTCFKSAINKYEDISRKWGQRPDFFSDIDYGKIWSSVSLNLLIPDNGYVEVTEIPDDVIWTIESRERIKEVTLSDGTKIPVYDYKYISLGEYCKKLPKPTYKFKTYAYVSELEPNDVIEGDKAMGLLIALLRKNYGVEIDLIKYVIIHNLLKVWEKEPVGFLKHLRQYKKVTVGEKEVTCESLIKDIDNASLDVGLLLLLNEINPLKFNEIHKELDKVKALAKRYVYYLCDVIKIEGKLVSKSLPDLIIIDSYLDKFSITYNGQTKIYSMSDRKKMINDISNIVNQILMKTKGNEEVIVSYSDRFDDYPMLKRFTYVIEDEVKKKFDSPIPLSKIEETLLGKSRILNMEMQLSNKYSNGEPISDNEFSELFKIRAEMISILYNYLNEQNG
ncbi:DEAD/DEAH box helicase [Sulfolobus tengchongensis]|uniref:DEAD/DEAH box helicase n=1 Tax=Sulfolobus tengchongensis TaxID=207809 RepID=A0AAX4L1P2_9CREN